MAGAPAAQWAEPAPPTRGRVGGPHSPARAAASASRLSRFPSAPASPSPPKQLCGDPEGPRTRRRLVQPTQRRVSPEGPGMAVRAAAKRPGGAGRPALLGLSLPIGAAGQLVPTPHLRPPTPPVSSPEVGGPRPRPLRGVTATCAWVRSSSGGESPLGPSAPGHARPEHSDAGEPSRQNPLRGANRPETRAARGAGGRACGGTRPLPAATVPSCPVMALPPRLSAGPGAALSARWPAGRRLGPQVVARGRRGFSHPVGPGPACVAASGSG